MSGEDGTWGMVWHEIGAVGVGIPECLMLEFVETWVQSLVAALQCSAADPHWTHPGGTEISGYWRVCK